MTDQADFILVTTNVETFEWYPALFQIPPGIDLPIPGNARYIMQARRSRSAAFTDLSLDSAKGEIVKIAEDDIAKTLTLKLTKPSTVARHLSGDYVVGVTVIIGDRQHVLGEGSLTVTQGICRS